MVIILNILKTNFFLVFYKINMNKFDTISKIWNYFQGCSNSVGKNIGKFGISMNFLRSGGGKVLYYWIFRICGFYSVNIQKNIKKIFSRFFSISVQLGQGIASHTRDVTLQREVISALLENPHIPLTLLETPYILLTLLKNSI